MCLEAQSRHPIRLFVHLLIDAGGTNNNCGVEGGWNGVKKEVCGTAGSTSSLAVLSVIQSLLRFLNNKSKEQASYSGVS
jgi:hypothetical protein